MTSYYLSIGYISGYSFKGTREEAWVQLVEEVTRLRDDTAAIVAEARRLGSPETCDRGCCSLQEMANAYASRDDLTFLIVPDVNTWKAYIVQYASGDRSLKEHVRRAFCRLVIEAMHRKGIEVNLKVF